MASLISCFFAMKILSTWPQTRILSDRKQKCSLQKKADKIYKVMNGVSFMNVISFQGDLRSNTLEQFKLESIIGLRKVEK